MQRSLCVRGSGKGNDSSVMLLKQVTGSRTVTAVQCEYKQRKGGLQRLILTEGIEKAL